MSRTYLGKVPGPEAVSERERKLPVAFVFELWGKSLSKCQLTRRETDDSAPDFY